jgi:aminoglycoside N3'-acetyltransferase
MGRRDGAMVIPIRNTGVAFKEVVLVTIERLIRQLYWSVPSLRQWRRRQPKAQRPQVCHQLKLLKHLESIGVKAGALVLVHTGMNCVEIHNDDGKTIGNSVAQSQVLLDDLIGLVGSEGTLVMPTHAKYQEADALYQGNIPANIIYDPKRTPCYVGLVNEFFWRRKGVKRSLFPYNMLAASGPLADELLTGNLHDGKPSPHGITSGYYRICQREGLVVSIGVSLRECLTMAHVVEEVSPEWPIEDFFEERICKVVQEGIPKEWVVRLRREEYGRFCYCRKKMGRDLVTEGVIHEGCVGTLRVDWAKAKEVYEFFQRKTAKQPYPYFGMWMMRTPWRKESLL